MARKTSPFPAIAIAVLALVLLATLNPSQSDFKAYLSRSAEASAKEKVDGKVGELFGKLSAGVAGAVSSAYERNNFIFASSFVSKALDGTTQRSYLGIAKLFVRLK